jgi:hypothetical protein
MGLDSLKGSRDRPPAWNCSLVQCGMHARLQSTACDEDNGPSHPYLYAWTME